MKKMLFPFTAENPRTGEGSAVLLRDGRVFLLFSRFSGAADHDGSCLAGGFLDVETGRLSEERILFPEGHWLNQMSVSLERLLDGSVGLVFMRKLSAGHAVVLFSRSPDECRSWTEPRMISHAFAGDYFVVNNDRLRALSSGRLVLPVCVYSGGFKGVPSCLVLWYSDDMGTT